MSDKRQVSVEEGEDRSTKEGIMFIESSAKAGFNIKALFRKLANALPGMESAQTSQPATNRKQTTILRLANTDFYFTTLSAFHDSILMQPISKRQLYT